MKEKTIKNSSSIDPISGKLDKIKELIIKFYGEKYRNDITEKLENTIFIFVDRSQEKVKSSEFIEKVKTEFDKYECVVPQSLYDNLKEFYIKSLNSEGELVFGLKGLCTPIINLKNTNKSYSAVILPEKEELSDYILFHELNHAITTSFGFINDKIEYKVGFSCQRKSSPKFNNENWEQTLPFTEVINDYFAYCIYSEARVKGLKIGDKGEENVIYKSVFPMLEPFLEENFNLIKKAFIENNQNEIASEIGEENYKKLVLLTYYMLEFCKEKGTTYNFYDFLCEKFADGFDIFEFAYDYGGENLVVIQYLNVFKQARKIYDSILDYKIEKNRFDDGLDSINEK